MWRSIMYLVLAISCSCLALLGCVNPVNSASDNSNDPGFAIKTISVGKNPGSIETADFNRDGYPDLVLANTEDSSLDVFLNDGQSNFIKANGSPFFTNQYPNDISVVDINKDGYQDLCIANTETSLLTVLSGNGKGQFQQVKGSPFTVHSKPHTHGVTADDFNGDGSLDLATDDWGENKIVILSGNGNGNFSNERFYDVGKRPYQRLRSADLNKDGRADIVTTNLEGNNATVLLADGDGNFHQPKGSPYACGDAPFGIAIEDVNGDGNADLAIINSPTITAESNGSDGLFVLLGDGSGNFSALKGSPFKTGKSPSRIAIGDLNGDGINDIVVTNYNEKSLSIFYMGKKGVDSEKTARAGNRPNGISINDMNSDGKNDIIISNAADNNIMIFLKK